MRFLGKLALLFVVVPIAELVLLIQLGRFVGLLPTLLLVLLTGAGGAMLARAEGLRVLFQFQKELASGRLPGQPLLDGISVLVGGALLLTPGLLTDLAGLSLLFPPTRRRIQARLRARLERQIVDGSIRVVTTGPGLRGGGFGWGFDATGPRAEGEPDSRDPAGRLDPRHGIVIEPDDG